MLNPSFSLCWPHAVLARSLKGHRDTHSTAPGVDHAESEIARESEIRPRVSDESETQNPI